jgi:GT2 family glycosyltransferase
MHTSPAAPPAATPTLDLSIVIVSWNVWPLLQACLRSLAAATSVPATTDETPDWRCYGPQQQYTVEVIVVDSASSDETVTALPAAFPWVRLLASDSNLGFSRGNNWGYQAGRGRFVFFLNPDTELQPAACADTLTLLHEALAQEARLGMVGPQLRYGDGSWQNSRHRFPTPWTGFLESTWLGQWWAGNPWQRHYHLLDHAADQPIEADWLTGAALFCRRAALAEIVMADGSGPFDEQFFMYSEELDLCRRMKLAGWRIFYEPRARILHYEGRSSEQVVTRRHLLFNTSKIRYYRKHFGRGWAALLRSYLLFEYAIQLALETFKWLLRHKPALRRARMQAYGAIVRSGLRV